MHNLRFGKCVKRSTETDSQDKGKSRREAGEWGKCLSSSRASRKTKKNKESIKKDISAFFLPHFLKSYRR